MTEFIIGALAGAAVALKVRDLLNCTDSVGGEPIRLADGWWYPKASNPVPPPPPPPAPPTITEGCCRGNVKNEHFREMPKGPPPALQSKPALTDQERDALEWCLSLPILHQDVVRMLPLRSLLERLA